MYDVGPTDQCLERGARLGRLEIERDAALAALAPHERPLDVAHRVTGGRLELDHVCAEVGQLHRAERAGEEVPEVEHLDAVEQPPPVVLLPRSVEKSSTAEVLCLRQGILDREAFCRVVWWDVVVGIAQDVT